MSILSALNVSILFLTQINSFSPSPLVSGCHSRLFRNINIQKSYFSNYFSSIINSNSINQKLKISDSSFENFLSPAIVLNGEFVHYVYDQTLEYTMQRYFDCPVKVYNCKFQNFPLGNFNGSVISAMQRLDMYNVLFKNIACNFGAICSSNQINGNYISFNDIRGKYASCFFTETSDKTAENSMLNSAFNKINTEKDFGTFYHGGEDSFVLKSSNISNAYAKNYAAFKLKCSNVLLKENCFLSCKSNDINGCAGFEKQNKLEIKDCVWKDIDVKELAIISTIVLHISNVVECTITENIFTDIIHKNHYYIQALNVEKMVIDECCFRTSQEYSVLSLNSNVDSIDNDYNQKCFNIMNLNNIGWNLKRTATYNPLFDIQIMEVNTKSIPYINFFTVILQYVFKFLIFLLIAVGILIIINIIENKKNEIVLMSI